MAYTIISQNNTTTTLSDENGNVITVPARVTLATSTDYTIIKVNNNSVDLEDGDGKIIRGVPACVVLAGGGDDHNKGYYTDLTALQTAYPTAEAGDWAIVGATDTVWIWDSDNSEWVDSDQKGQVTSVNGQTGDVTLTIPDAVQYSTMPTASADNLGDIVQFTGTTDANYTNGYFYKCGVASTTPASATIAQTTGSTLSDLTVNGETFWEELEEYDIPQQTGDYAFTYNGGTGYWDYGDDYFDLSDFGVTYNGTPADGDVLTISVTAPSTTYSWSQVSVQPAPSGLPDQTGQSGKFLTTDGTDASWSDKPLVNTATHSESLTILGNSATQSNCVNIGSGSSTTATSGVAVGSNASAAAYSVAIGGAALVWSAANASGNTSIAIGYSAKATAASAIQIGAGTNNNTRTLRVSLGNDSSNYELLSADGTVPHARLTNAVVSNAVTIAVADWNGGTTCTKTISGLTATSVVWVAPDNASQSDYLTAGVYASAQTTDTITFTCTTTPTSALTVYVIYC